MYIYIYDYARKISQRVYNSPAITVCSAMRSHRNTNVSMYSQLIRWATVNYDMKIAHKTALTTTHSSLFFHVTDICQRQAVFVLIWKLFFSRYTSVYSALEALRLCAIYIYYWHWHWHLARAVPTQLSLTGVTLSRLNSVKITNESVVQYSPHGFDQMYTACETFIVLSLCHS